MGAHLIDGEFQSDKYPTTPRGKVPLSTKDPMAQDLLWIYAERHRLKDAEFSDDLEAALVAAGYPRKETLCFDCQPEAVGAFQAVAETVPLCKRCGKTCVRGHWVQDGST
jgi:hypothetical protein